jgi:ABC-type Na+ transport system ATPase subunit NatA
MIGFLKPSSGTAYIQGMDIRTEMDRIYSCMGVCPQHEYVYFSQASLSQTFGFFSQRQFLICGMLLLLCSLLWGQLTGREHLLFYGRLKNLKGTELFSVSYATFY